MHEKRAAGMAVHPPSGIRGSGGPQHQRNRSRRGARHASARRSITAHSVERTIEPRPRGWRSQEHDQTAASSEIEFFEKIVAFIINHDEGWEVLDLNPPNRFHAEFRVVEQLDFPDAVLSKVRG